MSNTISLNEITNQLFFTKKDDSVTGTSQRDPLGLQPIWSFFGRQVINHLTTISTSIHGFREVLLCLSICEELNGYKNITYSDLILLFEQIFIYTAISKKSNTEGILGADNGKARFYDNDENPEIDVLKTILVREISLGYFGRYKTPLTTMGIINSKGQLIIENKEIKKLYDETRYKQILKAFKSFIDIIGSRKFQKFTGKDDLYQAVFGKFRESECDFWKQKLLEVDGKENELMKLCYDMVNNSKYSTTQELFKHLPQTKEVTNILILEPYLRCIEEVFYKAISSKKIESIEIDNLAEHCRRYEAFSRISSVTDSDLCSKRIEYLKNYCNPNKYNYIENVLNYHKIVCDQKKSSSWVTANTDGIIQSFVSETVTVDINNWGREYYISSLKSIKNEIESFK